MKPTLHLLGIFHTQHTAKYSHCAFTGKALRFPKMMQMYGYKVIEYSNEGSESTADEKVEIMSDYEFNNLYGRRRKEAFVGNDALIGSDGHKLFEKRLIYELKKKIKPKDIVCHPFGHVHEVLLTLFPNNQHIETGIGYPILMANSFKIFETNAWMHYHQGRENRQGKNYEWVVPNYYDLEDWDPKYEKGSYYAFLGRIDKIKGMDTLRALADYVDIPIVLHGQGDAKPWSHPMIEYRGPIHGRARNEFLRNARALLAPSNFTEPFCGMSVEAMLCGTPVVSVNYGAFTETITEGVGFRCNTLQDWLDGLDGVETLDRKFVADTARARFSLQACGKKYDKIFKDLTNLHGKGWYEVNKINYYQIEREEGPFADRLAEWIKNTYNPAEALDIGCGPGIYTTALRNHGVSAIGIDIDARVHNKEWLVQEDLLTTTRKSNLAICLEVAEHIDPELSDEIIKSVCNCVNPGGTLIWTAAQPGQSGVGHINCQTKDFWDEKILKQGLTRDQEKEDQLKTYIESGYHMGWFLNNVMVYKK